MFLGPVEGLFRAMESVQLSRGAILQDIPSPSMRMTGGIGTLAYSEWAYVIGLFQSLVFHNLPKRPIRALDIGCGAGRIHLAIKPHLTDEDTYLGIDVNADFVENCRRHYSAPNVQFLHTEAANAYYAKGTDGGPKAWPMATDAHNLITAISVWTHLREEDFRFYLDEVGRVLSPGGRAIISFFILDEHYRPEAKTDKVSRFYPQPEKRWIFDTPAYGSEDWFAPKWAKLPEDAIGVTKAAFDECVRHAGLKVAEYYPGSWKDRPSLYFQDVVVLERG